MLKSKIVSSYIFTDFQTNNESGTSVAKEYQSAAKWRGCAFVPVNLTCQVAENERRIRSAERLDLVARGKGMLTDCEILRKYRATSEIYQFHCPEALSLDVTKLSPSQAANQILQHIEKVVGWQLHIEPSGTL